jgi:hypothetical protein
MKPEWKSRAQPRLPWQTVITGPQSVTCPACGMTSHNANDVAQLYCGNCDWWTSDPELAALMPARTEE